MSLQYGILDDVAERLRLEAEKAAAEQQRYFALRELEERQRREKEQAEAIRQYQADEQEKAAAALKAEQAREAAKVEQERVAEAQRKADADLKAEQERYLAEEREMAQRSLKVRDEQSHHQGRMRADLDELWEREERRLEEEKRQIVRNDPNNSDKIDRHQQHTEQMYDAWLFPQQFLAQQQEAERQQLAASPVQTLATQTARQAEESPAPGAAPSKSAADREHDELMAAFDQAHAENVQKREQGLGLGGGRELDR